MKYSILLLSIFIAAFIPFNEPYVYDASAEEVVITMDNIDKAISADRPVAPCTDASGNTSSDTCSCIAAGGCSFDPGSSCYIIFCDGTTENESFNHTPKNITTIEQPCPEAEEEEGGEG